LVVLLLFLADGVLLRIVEWAPATNLIESPWNWEGKFAAFAFALAICLTLPAPMRTQIGLWRGPSLDRWRLLWVLLVLHLVLASLRGLFFGETASPEWRTIAYQISAPGLHEELTFRGLWWVLLARSLDPGRIAAGKIPWWTLAATTTLFGSVHAIGWDAAGGVNFEPLYFVATGVSGLLFGLMQAFGRSVWLPLVAHNLGNAAIFAWPMFLPVHD
jgi:uncharacterized protein